MLNQVVLVGRLAKDITLEEGENKSALTLAVPRSFKNEKGEYDTDIIECLISGNVATNAAEYCKKGDIVGVKGRVQTTKIEKYHTTMEIPQIIAEKITFLSSSKKEEE